MASGRVLGRQVRGWPPCETLPTGRIDVWGTVRAWIENLERPSARPALIWQDFERAPHNRVLVCRRVGRLRGELRYADQPSMTYGDGAPAKKVL